MTQNEPFKLILEIDGQRLARPELISRESFSYKYLTHRGTNYYNWYPEISQATRKIYDQEIEKIGQNRLKLSKKVQKRWDWRFSVEKIALSDAEELIKL